MIRNVLKGNILFFLNLYLNICKFVSEQWNIKILFNYNYMMCRCNIFIFISGRRSAMNWESDSRLFVCVFFYEYCVNNDIIFKWYVGFLNYSLLPSYWDTKDMVIFNCSSFVRFHTSNKSFNKHTAVLLNFFQMAPTQNKIFKYHGTSFYKPIKQNNMLLKTFGNSFYYKRTYQSYIIS